MMVKNLTFVKLFLLLMMVFASGCAYGQPGSSPSHEDAVPTPAAEPRPQPQEKATESADEIERIIKEKAEVPPVEREEPVWVSDQLSTESVRLYTGNRGVVKIGWKTHSEKENFGFRIYRARQSGGPYTLVNKTIIAGAGNSSTENRYVYYDKNVWVGYDYYYYLEEISFAGQAQRMMPRDYKKVVSLLYYPEKDPDFEPMPVYKTEEIHEPAAEPESDEASATGDE